MALVQANAAAAVGYIARPSGSSLHGDWSFPEAQFLRGGLMSRWLTYVELRVALRSGLEGLLAGLPLVDAGSAGVPSAGDLGRAQARGGAKGGAADDARHGGRNWDCGWRSGEWRVGGGWWWWWCVCDVWRKLASGSTELWAKTRPAYVIRHCTDNRASQGGPMFGRGKSQRGATAGAA